jgi:putative transport protein
MVRLSDIVDVAFIDAASTIGALVGAFVYKIGDVPLALSNSGGALISGLFFGWLLSGHPTFGRTPSSTVWFMNSVGLNVVIAVVGISSGGALWLASGNLRSACSFGVFSRRPYPGAGDICRKYIFQFHSATCWAPVRGRARPRPRWP